MSSSAAFEKRAWRGHHFLRQDGLESLHWAIRKEWIASVLTGRFCAYSEISNARHRGRYPFL